MHNTTTPEPAISVILPAYNESSRVSESLQEVWSYFHPLGAEIMLVDDGSRDDTLALAQAFAADHDGVRVLAMPHRGKAATVLSGLEAARGAFVGFMDIDLATPLATWEACDRAFAEGAGVAIASREGAGATRVDEPEYRHIMGRMFNYLVRLLLLPGIHDTQCGFKFFTKSALDDVLARARLYRHAGEVSLPRVTAFDVELLYVAKRLGYRIVTIPVTWQYGQQSKVNPVTDTLQNLLDVLKVRVNGWLGRYT